MLLKKKLSIIFTSKVIFPVLRVSSWDSKNLTLPKVDKRNRESTSQGTWLFLLWLLSRVLLSLDLVLPWELQSTSPFLWGRSRGYQNAKHIPSRKGWPSLKMHKDGRRRPDCGHCNVLRHNNAVVSTLPQAHCYGSNSPPCSGPQCLHLQNVEVQTRKVLFQPQSWFKTKTKNG